MEGEAGTGLIERFRGNVDYRQSPHKQSRCGRVETAKSFKDALSGDFAGAFREIVFAITDWSPERRMLGSFRDAFSPA